MKTLSMVGMQGGDGLVGSISNMNVVRYTSVLFAGGSCTFAFSMPFCCLFDALSLGCHPDGRQSLTENRVWASSSRERR